MERKSTPSLAHKINMTKTHTISIALIGALLLLAGVLILKPFNQAEGAAFTGSSAYLQIATTTTMTTTVGGNNTLFQAVSDGSCKARVITTTNAAIWFVFADASVSGDLSSTSLAINNGHYQATGTTAVYDSGLYGCGRLVATTSLTSKVITSQF